MTKDETAIADCLLFLNRTLDKCSGLRAYIDNTCGRTGVHVDCKRILRDTLGDVDDACRSLKAAKKGLT